MTQLERLQKTGIRRIGTARSGFSYKSASGAAANRADLARIKALKIPPAWTDVVINRSAQGVLQALGIDSAGRWQYLYHDNQIKKRERKKFERLLHFAQALPSMRKTVASDLRAPGLGREKVMACILRILSTCFLRPGSQSYASDNGSYGIATLRPKPVRVKGDTIEFNFPGKRQIRQHHELKDRTAARIVRELLKHPAAEVFKYRDADDQFIDVKRRHINQHIKQVMGERFSAKDFRTWAGTLICACALARPSDLPDTEAGRKRKIAQAIKETAGVLGNTPAVCRSAYIFPQVLASFEKGRVVERYFNSIEEMVNHRGISLHPAEKSLLGLLMEG